MELDLPLPAECWIRYGFPAPLRSASARSFRTTSSWWYRGKNLFPFLFTSLLIFRFNELRVVFEDVREPVGSEKSLPEVVTLESVWIRRIPGAVVPALIERKEPGRLRLEMRAKAHLGFVYGEVSYTSAKLENEFAGIAVPLVLLHRVGHRLLSKVGGSRGANAGQWANLCPSELALARPESGPKRTLEPPDLECARTTDVPAWPTPLPRAVARPFLFSRP